MSGQGYAVMGTAVATGPNRAIDAANRAINSPLLEDNCINGAQGILINVTGSSTLSLQEVHEASSIIQKAAHENANIIFGAVQDDAMKESVKITVIAAGFREVAGKKTAQRPHICRRRGLRSANSRPRRWRRSRQMWCSRWRAMCAKRLQRCHRTILTCRRFCADRRRRRRQFSRVPQPWTGSFLPARFHTRSVDTHRADLRAKQTQISVEILLGRHYEATVTNFITAATKLQAVRLVRKSHPR